MIKIKQTILNLNLVLFINAQVPARPKNENKIWCLVPMIMYIIQIIEEGIMAKIKDRNGLNFLLKAIKNKEGKIYPEKPEM